MQLLQRFKISVYLLTFLSFLGFTFAEHNPSLLFVGVVVLLVSWLLVEGRPGRALPRWCINVGVLISSMLLFRELVIQHQDVLLLALGHFMIYIVICKLFENKSTRDYSQILTLSLLILVIGSIFSSSILFGAILGLYLALGVYAIALFHLRNETIAAQRTAALTTAVPNRLFHKDVRRVAWAAGIAMALVAVAVFMFFPRNRGRDMFGAWTLNASNLFTGFSDTVSFEAGSPIQQSNVVVMQVRVSQNGAPIGELGEQPYFRGLTLDFYDMVGRQWIRFPNAANNFIRPLHADPATGRMQVIDPNNYNPATLIKQNYTLFSPGEILFTIPDAAIIRPNRQQISTLMHFRRENSFVLQAQPLSELQYEVQSVPDDKSDVARLPGFRPPPLAFFGSVTRFGALPAPLPAPIVAKAHQIADPILHGSSTPTPDQIRDVANQMIAELSTYPYTLENPAPIDPNLDPTADFLLNRQKIGGHCEYFASSMVLMCTALNIPARMVTGYHGGDYNAVGSFFVVRQQHAHAWVEIYLADEGWTRFDPTPPAPDTDIDDTSVWWKWSQELLQAIEHQWLTTVIAFDDSARRYLWDSMLAQLSAVPSAVAGTLWALGAGFTDLVTSKKIGATGRAACLVDLLLLLTATAWLGKRLLRQQRSPLRKMLRQVDRAQRKELAQELGFFDELLTVLGRTGVRRTSSQTPREYVQMACAGRPDAGREAAWVVETFYDVWFGHGKMTGVLRERIQKALNRLRQLLAQ